MVIVGAGISGLRCAELLSDAGLDVIVLEKNGTIGGSFGENVEAFPEYHYSMLDLPVPSKLVKEVTLFCGSGIQNKQKLEIEFSQPIFRMVKRGRAIDSLDSYLYQRAKKGSAKFYFGEKFASAKSTNNGTIETGTLSGTIYESKVVIACDGVFSAVKKFLGLAGLQKTEGVGYIAKVAGAKVSKGETVGIFNYKEWPGSYCYILGYPEEEYATVGMTLRSPYISAPLQDYFDSIADYLPEILGEAKVIDLTRGFVTFGSRDRPLSAGVGDFGFDNVLFVGEAGGFQDPTLAFGLAPALVSARLASDSVIRAFANRNYNLLNRYPIMARERLVKDESRRVSFRYVLESLSEQEIATFLAYIARHPEKIERVMRTGEYLRNFLPMVFMSATRNPGMLTFPFRYARVSRALKNHQRVMSVRANTGRVGNASEN